MINITQQEFEKIKDILYKKTGVFLKPSKMPLVSARLSNRITSFGFNNFDDYSRVLERGDTAEIEFFINALTTNETYFFRHTEQFNFLFEKILPELKESKKGVGEISFWSAASSTGEEPYSLAIACKEFLKNSPGLKAKIYASDVNSDVIKKAQEGVYPERSLKEMSASLKTKYFNELVSSGPKPSKKYKLKDEIRSSVTYEQHNLLDLPKKKNIDVIFLRNVMIYFDKASKQKVMSNIQQALSDNGYFFISLSESLNDVKTNLTLVNRCIFKK